MSEEEQPCARCGAERGFSRRNCKLCWRCRDAKQAKTPRMRAMVVPATSCRRCKAKLLHPDPGGFCGFCIEEIEVAQHTKGES